MPTILPDDHDHTPDEERRIREAALDKTLADTFPASDPPSTNPNPDNHDALKGPYGKPPGGANPPADDTGASSV
jgi:hypothetical protein